MRAGDTTLEPGANPKSTSPKRWMVVDDNEGILELVAGLLESSSPGPVCRCHGAAEAPAIFTTESRYFEFVICDLEMPGLDGIELGRRLLKLAPSLKILLATGSASITRKEACDEGFCGILPKPFRLADLRRALNEAGIVTDPNTETLFAQSFSAQQNKQRNKMKNKIVIALLALSASAWIVTAQDNNQQPPPDRNGFPPRGHRPPPPIMMALDANQDGQIDADEIAKASESLKKLDLNGDGVLTRDELMPPPPGGPEGFGQEPPPQGQKPHRQEN